MGKMKSPWGKGTTIAIVVFLVALMAMFYTESSHAKTRAEVTYGATAVGGEVYDSAAFLLSEISPDDKYQLGLILQVGLTCRVGSECKRGESDRANQAFFLQRNVHYGDFFMFIGASYWHNTSPAWNSHTPYTLGMGYDITDNVTITYKHFSTGGTSSNNGGLDFITIGYTF